MRAVRRTSIIPCVENRGILYLTAVAQPDLQIPAEVRDLAEKCVEQARSAFEAFTGAAQKAISSVDATLPVAAKEGSGKAYSYAEASMKATFDLAQKLIRAKDAQEALQLQTDFMKAQMEAVQRQASELNAAMQKAITGKSFDIS